MTTPCLSLRHRRAAAALGAGIEEPAPAFFRDTASESRGAVLESASKSRLLPFSATRNRRAEALSWSRHRRTGACLFPRHGIGEPRRCLGVGIEEPAPAFFRDTASESRGAVLEPASKSRLLPFSATRHRRAEALPWESASKSRLLPFSTTRHRRAEALAFSDAFRAICIFLASLYILL